MTLINIERSQQLREKCGACIAGESVHDIVGALQRLTVDVLLSLPLQTETSAKQSAKAIAKDIAAIIEERFAARGKGH